MRTALLIAALGLASTAIAQQIPVPAFGSTFTSTLTRGFWFQAPANFVITGLSVPNEAVQPFQVVEVIDLGTTPPPAYPGTVNGTQLFYDNSSAGGSLIPTAIPCVSGNYYGILGACTPTVGSTTSYNSYGTPAGVFASSILGIPTTLTRFGTQFGIGAGGNQACWSEAAGQISRVDVYVAGSGGGTIATNTALGAGCYRQFGSAYENFAAAAGFDLANSVISFLPTGTGYVMISGGGAFLPVGSTGTPTNVAIGDDVEQTVPFTVGSFPGWTGVTVCSNGYVSKASGNGTGFTPTPATFLAGSQDWFSLGWHDFNPGIAGSGQIKVEESAAVTVITWDGVFDFGGSAANTSTMQLQLYSTGIVTMAWGTMTTAGNGFLTGFSPGGANLDPGSVDLSTVLATSPITLAVPEVSALALAASTRPVTGTNWNLNTTNVPATGVVGIDVFGLSDPGINDLAFIGLPGCGLRASLDVLSAWPVAGSSHAFGLAVPNNPALVNFHVFVTSAVLQPGVNAFGAITSNGVDGKVGDL